MADVSLRKRIWGWYFFDWASQPYNTLMLTFIFGPYFAQTATAHLVADGMAEGAARAQAQALWDALESQRPIPDISPESRAPDTMHIPGSMSTHAHTPDATQTET